MTESSIFSIHASIPSIYIVDQVRNSLDLRENHFGYDRGSKLLTMGDSLAAFNRLLSSCS